MNKRLLQLELAETLKIISMKGVKGFYEGDVADKIVSDMENREGSN